MMSSTVLDLACGRKGKSAYANPPHTEITLLVSLALVSRMGWKVGSKARGTCASDMAEKAYFMANLPGDIPLLGRRGGPLLRGVIAALGAHRQPAVALGLGVNFDGAIS